MLGDLHIGENTFKVILPDLMLSEAGDGDAYNSRQIMGVMSTESKDRQSEIVLSKGLDFEEFLLNGHFNDNHSQQTSAIIGYPEEAKFHDDLGIINKSLDGTQGWTCRGYVLKGTKRADEIWELAKALKNNPSKKLGFSIEGKVIRRKNKCIEKASIRNVAITNCPVNTEATWDVLVKSFVDPDEAIKALSAGYATGPTTQTGGGALRTEDLDSDAKDTTFKKRKRKKEDLERALRDVLDFDGLVKAMDYFTERSPEMTDEAAAMLAKQLIIHEKRLRNEHRIG